MHVAKTRMCFNRWNDWSVMQNIWQLLQTIGEETCPLKFSASNNSLKLYAKVLYTVKLTHCLYIHAPNPIPLSSIWTLNVYCLCQFKSGGTCCMCFPYLCEPSAASVFWIQKQGSYMFGVCKNTPQFCSLLAENNELWSLKACTEYNGKCTTCAIYAPT